MNMLLEFLRITHHHVIRLLDRKPDRVVPTAKRIVQGCLVGAQVSDVLLLLGQALPDADDVAQVCQGDGLLGLFGLFYAGD